VVESGLSVRRNGHHTWDIVGVSPNAPV